MVGEEEKEDGRGMEVGKRRGRVGERGSRGKEVWSSGKGGETEQGARVAVLHAMNPGDTFTQVPRTALEKKAKFTTIW